MTQDAPEISPLAGFLEGLTAFLDESNEHTPEGEAFVERMLVQMPVEFYVRVRESSPDGQEVAAIESLPPQRTLTSVPPVLHQLRLCVEVDSAEHRESGLES
jgi:hypothetical protein